MDNSDDSGVNRMVKYLLELALGKSRERKSMTLSREEVQKRKRDLDMREVALDQEKLRLRNMCQHLSYTKLTGPTLRIVNNLESQNWEARYKCDDCGHVFERA